MKFTIRKIWKDSGAVRYPRRTELGIEWFAPIFNYKRLTWKTITGADNFIKKYCQDSGCKYIVEEIKG